MGGKAQIFPICFASINPGNIEAGAGKDVLAANLHTIYLSAVEF